jgi:hypothetical protein
MRPNRSILTAMALSLTCSLSALAGEAATSATAGSSGRGPGTAGATATYDGGGIGYTDTQAQSGRFNFARGLSVGLDQDGLSLSTSYAVAGQRGPAVAGTFNMNIGLDGQVSSSVGRSVAQGDPQRHVSAGGSAGSVWGQPAAVATASGDTGPRGEVRAVTRSDTSRRAHRYVNTSRRILR